ncbi:MAG: hypothetical protein ABW040_06920 [Microbacteriaceae bacterium]
MTDDALERRLADALERVDGVIEVLPIQPIVHATVEGIAATLDLPLPEGGVDIDRASDGTTITAHLATSTASSTPEVLRAAAASIREVLSDQAPGSSAPRIVVSARLIEDARATAVAVSAPRPPASSSEGGPSAA